MILAKRLFCSALVFCLAILIIACGDPVPIKEMTEAKKAISRAYTVQADNYAKDELKAAEDLLYKSHDYIKSEDMDKAKESAVQSREKALEAYNKSLPLLAGDAIRAAEKSLNEAGETSADRLAKDEYTNASELVAKANEQYQNKAYEDAYNTALAADAKAKEARELAIGRKDVLADAIAEVKYTLDEAAKYDAEKYAFEKYSLARENLNAAEEAYGEMKLRQGFTAIEIAKVNADEAYIAALDGSAQDRIQQADAYLAGAEKSEGAEVAKDEVQASREALDNARAMYGEGKFKESMDYASESMKLARIVMETKKPVETETATAAASGGDTGTAAAVEEEKDYDLYRVVYREKLKDCLWRIAEKYYDNPWLWKKIYAANRDRIKDPDLIYPGWILKIPRIK